MSRMFLVFDFGTNEDAAQHARHRLDGWKQGFRLGSKVQFKFERQSAGEAEGSSGPDVEHADGKKAAEPGPNVRLLVRLDFSNHEKHLAQTWADRIPADDAFKGAKGEVIRQDGMNFEDVSELFESLK